MKNTDDLSKTERTYTEPVLAILQKEIIHLDDIPIEVLRGLLFLFEGKLNWKKDKGEMRRELRRYLKYEGNMQKLTNAVEKLVSGE